MSEKTTYVQLDRNFTEWRFFKDGNVVKLFLYLLLSASIKKTAVGEVDLERGQLITSLDVMSEKTGLTSQQVRTALCKLVKFGTINKKSTNKNTIITICNYSSYQGRYQGEQQTNNKQITNEQQTNNKQITTYNNNNNNNNINNENKDAHAREFIYNMDVDLSDPKIENGEVVRIVEDCEFVLISFRDFFESPRGLNLGRYSPRADDYQAAKELAIKVRNLKNEIGAVQMSDEIFCKHFIKKTYESDDFYKKHFSIALVNKQFNDIKSKLLNLNSNGKEKQFDAIEYVREAFSDYKH